MNAPTIKPDDHPQATPVPRLILGMTGGIAAYKSAELARLFVKAGVKVTVVMTPSAQQFVTAVTMQALSGNKVYADLWDPDIPNNMAHIELTRDADLVLVAPTTGNFMAKLASGLADDLLSTLCLARTPQCPLILAPAMNREMWDQPATQRNVQTLLADGLTLLGPAPGNQACGETGMGRMLEPADIFSTVMAALAAKSKTPLSTVVSKPLSLRKAVVTAGPTFEAIDPVRGITNSSSGKMGYAIAEALRNAGAEVTLVSGPTALLQPTGMAVIQVKSASQMLDAVNGVLAGVDLFFAVAAVSDYTPADPKTQKMKKTAANMPLTLVPTVDILASVAARPNAPFCIGFAAECENIVEYASKKRQNKRIPMIVANDASLAIGSDDNAVTIIDASGEYPLARAGKAEIAQKVVAHATKLYLAVRPPSANNITSLKPTKHAKQ